MSTSDCLQDPNSVRGEAIRVLLVEDYSVVREALAAMLSVEDDIDVVATTTSGSESVGLAVGLAPDIVLMDVSARGLNGGVTARKIAEAAPDVAVIVLTIFDDPGAVVQAVADGARGYLPKSASRDELLMAIRSVAAGEAFLHQTITAPFLKRMAPIAERTAGTERLTDRELEVLTHLADGLASKQIAAALLISEETIKTHLARIYQKLGVSDRVQAVALALRSGLVE